MLQFVKVEDTKRYILQLRGQGLLEFAGDAPI